MRPDEDPTPGTDPRQKPLHGLDEKPASRIPPMNAVLAAILLVSAVVLAVLGRWGIAIAVGGAAGLLWLVTRRGRRLPRS